VVRLFEVAATLDPGDAGFPYDIGNHLSHLGRSEEAIVAFTRALTIDRAWRGLSTTGEGCSSTPGGLATALRTSSPRPAPESS
jgi:hypothetical protein